MRITSLQGCQRKTWPCLFLCFTLVYVECTHTSASASPSIFNQPLPLATHKLSTVYQKSENQKFSLATGLLNNETKHLHNQSQELHPIAVLDKVDSKSRKGYEKDIMLVLPVKSNATNANDTDLQMWYTQKPITTIIDDQAISKLEFGVDYDIYEDTKLSEDRHPYTNFLINKMPSESQKSPLHYGYPESSKFKEDLNGFQSELKLNWMGSNFTELTIPPTSLNNSNRTEATNAEVTLPDALSYSSQVAPVNVKEVYSAIRHTTLLKQSNEEYSPLDSHTLKPISASSSANYQTIPTTSPTMNKIEDEITSNGSTIGTIVQTTATQKTTPLFKTFSMNSMQPPSMTLASTTPTSTAVPTTFSTTTAASISLRDIVVYNVTEDVDDVPFISESLNVISAQNLSDFQFQMNHFEPSKGANFLKPDTQQTEAESFMEMNQSVSHDITNDMKNMLVELGIIKSDQFSISTTEKVIIRKELVTPEYDLNSYTGFKKLPINAEPADRTSISDDMNNLLSSFGLIPKKKSENKTMGNRISRQHNLPEADLFNSKINITLPFNFTDLKTNLSSNSESSSSQINDFESDVFHFLNKDELINNKDNPITLNSDMFPDDMKNTLETLGLLKQSLLHNRSVKNAHVFQPTSQLEKLNQEDAAKKITDVLRTIKSLSIETEANNITAEELEKRLQTITNSLESDGFNEVNDTVVLDMLSEDTNLKVIESIDNMTSKFLPTNETELVAQNETRSGIIQPIIETLSTSTENIIQTISPLNTTAAQTEMKPPNPLSTNEVLHLYETGKNESKRQEQNITSSSETPDIELTSITSSTGNTSIPAVGTEIFNINTEQPNVQESSSATSTTTGLTTSSATSTTTTTGLTTSSATSTTTTTGSTTLSTTSTTIGSSTSSEESNDSNASANNNAPIPALADSFGGGGVASTEPTAADLPTRRPNGLYFYLDWNTFLNVGADEDKRPVRIRFAPRAGNARNFLPITVP